MRYIVDRLEGGIAVCEDENKAFVDIPAEKLPDGVQSGDIIVENDGIFAVDRSATDKRREEMSALQNSLWE